MNEELRSYLDQSAAQLERERQQAVKKNRFYRISIPLRKVVIVLLIVSCAINIILPFFIISTIALGALAFWLHYWLEDPSEVFEAKLKEEILPQVMKAVNPTYEYAPNRYNRNTLIESGFMSKGFFSNTVRIEGEDYVKGRIHNVDVEFFEIRFFKTVTNYGKTAGGCILSLILSPIIIIKSIFSGNGDTELPFLGVVKDINNFFSGFFMHADFHKDFRGKVLMMPKENDRMTDRLHEISKPEHLMELTVENPYINEKYNIYTSDAQTGYYVLSPNLIERIEMISRKENALPILSFINGKMYFVIPWQKNFFRVNLNIPIDGAQFFIPFIEEINFFEKIVTDLNLDTRIWSKE